MLASRIGNGMTPWTRPFSPWRQVVTPKLCVVFPSPLLVSSISHSLQWQIVSAHSFSVWRDYLPLTQALLLTHKIFSPCYRSDKLKEKSTLGSFALQMMAKQIACLLHVLCLVWLKFFLFLKRPQTLRIKWDETYLPNGQMSRSNLLECFLQNSSAKMHQYQCVSSLQCLHWPLYP